MHEMRFYAVCLAALGLSYSIMPDVFVACSRTSDHQW